MSKPATQSKPAAQVTTADKIKVGSDYREVLNVDTSGQTVAIKTRLGNGWSILWRNHDQKVRVA